MLTSDVSHVSSIREGLISLGGFRIFDRTIPREIERTEALECSLKEWAQCWGTAFKIIAVLATITLCLAFFVPESLVLLICSGLQGLAALFCKVMEWGDEEAAVRAKENVRRGNAIYTNFQAVGRAGDYAQFFEFAKRSSGARAQISLEEFLEFHRQFSSLR